MKLSPRPRTSSRCHHGYKSSVTFRKGIFSASPEYLSACKIGRRLNIFISQDVWFIQRLFLALYTSLWKILTDFMSNNSPIPATQTQVHSWGFLCLPMKDKYLKKTNRKIWIILPLSVTSKSTKYREIFFYHAIKLFISTFGFCKLCCNNSTGPPYC